MYFLSQRTPTLQFLTNVIGMSLCLHLALFISWIQANVCDAVVSRNTVAVGLWKGRRHHCALPFSIFTLMKSHLLYPIWVCRQCVSHIEAAWNLAYSIGSSVFNSGSDPKLQV